MMRLLVVMAAMAVPYHTATSTANGRWLAVGFGACFLTSTLSSDGVFVTICEPPSPFSTALSANTSATLSDELLLKPLPTRRCTESIMSQSSIGVIGDFRGAIFLLSPLNNLSLQLPRCNVSQKATRRVVLQGLAWWWRCGGGTGIREELVGLLASGVGKRQSKNFEL